MITKTLSLVFVAALSLVIVLNTGWASPPITIEKITSQCINNASTLTLTMRSDSWNIYKKSTDLYFYNPPGVLSGQQWPSNINPATFNIAPGSGTFEVRTSGATSGIHSYKGVTCGGPQKKGMTWFHTASNATYGTITVGCGPSGPDRCDPAHGDTLCTQQLPVLCIYKPKPAFPLPVGLPVPNEYNRWSGGVVATTPPHAGNFTNTAEVNQFCTDVFGVGWRVAEFHDGLYWNFQAYGGTVSAPPCRPRAFGFTSTIKKMEIAGSRNRGNFLRVDDLEPTAD